MVEIRPLTAAEYVEILQQHDVHLRVSDGTPEGTWRFWMDEGQVWYRRLTWTQDQTESPDFLQAVLDDGGTTQLVSVATRESATSDEFKEAGWT